MKKNNIILIGMPTSGKTTIGKALAKRLDWQFLDGDRLIQDQEGRKLSEIIADVGNDGFLAIENRVNASIEGENQIIAPGGSVIYCPDAMKHFQEIGTIVYLKMSYRLLTRRLTDPVGRGVVLKPGETLRDLYDQRRPYFEKYADVYHNVDGIHFKKSIENLVKKLPLSYIDQKEGSVARKASKKRNQKRGRTRAL